MGAAPRLAWGGCRPRQWQHRLDWQIGKLTMSGGTSMPLRMAETPDGPGQARCKYFARGSLFSETLPCYSQTHG